MRTAAHRRRREAIEKEIASTLRDWRRGKSLGGRDFARPPLTVPRDLFLKVSDALVAMFEVALARANPEFDRGWFRRACHPDAPSSWIEHPNDVRARAEARTRRLLPADLRALDWRLAGIQDSVSAFAHTASRVTSGNRVMVNTYFLDEVSRALDAIAAARYQLVQDAFGMERPDPFVPWRPRRRDR